MYTDLTLQSKSEFRHKPISFHAESQLCSGTPNGKVKRKTWNLEKRTTNVTINVVTLKSLLQSSIPKITEKHGTKEFDI